MKKIPVIDVGRCNDCGSCLELCPAIFRKNKDTGHIEVIDLSHYPEEDIQEVISMCPTDCITWEEATDHIGVVKKEAAGRAIKEKVRGLLKSSDFENALLELCQMPGRQVINPLFSFLHDSNQEVKWAAVSAMGAVVANLADEDMESARVIMRRLMWNLNDESGGIGWGSPEAMGEILSNHEDLAKEYAHVLISYTRENGNYLEHEVLQRGLLWAIGRFAQARPEPVQNALPYLLPYLESPDATVRGLASWLMGLLGAVEATSRLQGLTHDQNQIQIYLDNALTSCRVMDLAQDALNAIRNKRKKYDSAPAGDL